MTAVAVLCVYANTRIPKLKNQQQYIVIYGKKAQIIPDTSLSWCAMGIVAVVNP